MRGRRSGLLALGLVGAWYAWRNRDRLGQQLNMLKEQANQLASKAQYQIEHITGRQDSPDGRTNGFAERARGETQR